MDWEAQRGVLYVSVYAWVMSLQILQDNLAAKWRCKMYKMEETLLRNSTWWNVNLDCVSHLLDVSKNTEQQLTLDPEESCRCRHGRFKSVKLHVSSLLCWSNNLPWAHVSGHHRKLWFDCYMPNTPVNNKGNEYDHSAPSTLPVHRLCAVLI